MPVTQCRSGDLDVLCLLCPGGQLLTVNIVEFDIEIIAAPKLGNLPI